MAYDVKSEEFANAWRIVSETLLAMIQQGQGFPTISIGGGNSPQPTPTAVSNPAPTPVSNPISNPISTPEPRTLKNTQYANAPSFEDGAYFFKRLASERDDHFYRIFEYSDNSFEFELCKEVAGDKELLQNLRDTQKHTLPAGVCVVQSDKGIDSDFTQIEVVERGRAVRSGRSVKVQSPCKIKVN